MAPKTMNTAASVLTGEHFEEIAERAMDLIGLDLDPVRHIEARMVVVTHLDTDGEAFLVTVLRKDGSVITTDAIGW